MERNVISVEGTKIKVMPRQAEVFSILLDAHPTGANTDDIAARLWGATGDPGNAYSTVGEHIGRLRAAINNTDWTVLKIFRGNFQLIREGL